MKRALAFLFLVATACDGAQGTEPTKGDPAKPNKENPSSQNPGLTNPQPNPVTENPIPDRFPGFDLSQLQPGSRRAFWDAISTGLSPCARPETIASCIKNNPGCSDCSYVARSAFRLARDEEVSAEQLGAHMDGIKESLAAPAVTIDLADTPMKGNPEASVVVVEFADFQCPVCAMVHEELAQLLPQTESKIKFYFKNFPLADKHPMAEPAARAALAAGKQGKFWEYHDLLFTRQEQLSEENLAVWAKELGLDAARFQADYSSKEVAAHVARDRKAGEAAGIRGTPSLFIDGRLFNDIRSAEAIKDAIDHAIAKKARQ